MNSAQATRITQLKNDAFSLVSRLLGNDFANYKKPHGLTVINEIFKFPPHSDLFCQIDYLYELSSGYANYPIQKWCIWSSFQASGKGFRKLQEAKTDFVNYR